MSIIRVVRHRETDYNQEGKYLGRIDVPLNRIGREQAAVIDILSF
ncbi:histidine phosphatase family protein [Patescibacteria group bacterium]|nr:histidine phosphatase family protein [Patescibacteria group bacterium]MBU1029108.1 histidine phosphatase family protein [Patescibacteria group bacterium]MBU1916012.1 histidine phosphatase family protein [Patescibacteria group bacterium]